jgi:ammonia channel protein AmtB
MVAVTPACGYVTVGSAMVIGIFTAMLSNQAVHFMKHGQGSVTDTLDVFAGVWGGAHHPPASPLGHYPHHHFRIRRLFPS